MKLHEITEATKRRSRKELFPYSLEQHRDFWNKGAGLNPDEYPFHPDLPNLAQKLVAHGRKTVAYNGPDISTPEDNRKIAGYSIRMGQNDWKPGGVLIPTYNEAERRAATLRIKMPSVPVEVITHYA